MSDYLWPEKPPLLPKNGRGRAHDIAVRLSRGVHPHHGLPLLKPEVHTCGECAHARRQASGPNKHWIKCALYGFTGGPATDIRAKWLACEKWKASR